MGEYDDWTLGAGIEAVEWIAFEDALMPPLIDSVMTTEYIYQRL